MHFVTMHFVLILLVLIIAIAKAGDFWTTDRFLSEHTAIEGNPISAWLMRRIGIVPALAVEWIIAVALAVVICAASWNLGSIGWMGTITMAAIAVFFIKTVIANAKFLK